MAVYARPDRDGPFRAQYEKNKKKIMTTQSICGICGKPVNFKQKYPHPLSPCIDHIVPIAKGGHPSDISNLQLAHWTCNRQKSDKFCGDAKQAQQKHEDFKTLGNRNLPQNMDWTAYEG